MLTSKKVLYFVLLCMLVTCYVVGIDYRSSSYDSSLTVGEIVDFSDSSFFAAGDSEQYLVTAVTPPEDDGEGSAAGPTVDTPTDNPEVTGPDVTEPSDTTTAATTTQATTQPYIPPTEAPTTAPTGQQTVATTTRPTTTTTRVTTRPTTTVGTTAEKTYSDSGSIHFAYSQVRMLQGTKGVIDVTYALGSQQVVTFTSKSPSVASVHKESNFSVEVTGLSVGTAWIQGTSSSGEVFYCRVTVTDFAGEVIRLTNEQRAAYGLGPLAPGPSLLQQCADIRLSESSRYFSHTRPSGRRFETVAQDMSLAYHHIGENLAYGQRTPEQVVAAWMASESHRNNILGRDRYGNTIAYTQICVSYGLSGNVPYWVQMFYAPPA